VENDLFSWFKFVLKKECSSHELDDLSEVQCDEIVVKQLPSCEHEVSAKCSTDPELIRCMAVCGGILACCGRNCRSRCHSCQTLNDPPVLQHGTTNILREHHVQHPCERRLYCEHQCDQPCSSDHACTTICKQPCRQVCPHARCKQYCSTPCAPCQEPCTWYITHYQYFSVVSNPIDRICPHYTCPVPCGSVCIPISTPGFINLTTTLGLCSFTL
jgi:hypothetical protein